MVLTIRSPPVKVKGGGCTIGRRSGGASMLPLTKQDLEPVLAAHRGTEALRQAVEGASRRPSSRWSPLRPVQLRVRVPACHLSGEIAARRGCSRPRRAATVVATGRRSRVRLFSTRRDEFDDRLPPGDTPRTLPATQAWIPVSSRPQLTTSPDHPDEAGAGFRVSASAPPSTTPASSRVGSTPQRVLPTDSRPRPGLGRGPEMWSAAENPVAIAGRSTTPTTGCASTPA